MRYRVKRAVGDAVDAAVASRGGAARAPRRSAPPVASRNTVAVPACRHDVRGLWVRGLWVACVDAGIPYRAPLASNEK